MIQFGKEVCTNLDAALRREWLETNGLGGFASGTVNGCNTRRYHGLLVAATKPPVGRFVLLSKLEETLIIDGRRYELGTNRYPGVVHPQGFQYLKQFRLDPFPIFTFSVETTEIEKTVFMVQGENTCASPKLCPCPKINNFGTISSISRFAMTMVHVQLRPAEFGTDGPLLSFASQTTSGESGASPATRGTEA
jgi:glycogen debranching enzyme